MNIFIFALFAALFLAIGGGTACAEQKYGHGEGRQISSGATADTVPADIRKHISCPHCGMDREKFAYSRMLITFAGGITVGVCSIHCAVIEILANRGKAISLVEVADYNTRKLIAADKAFWVIGGIKRGVMTTNPKWAFASKDDATDFAAKFGGRVGAYIEALFLARKD